ncbi:MAG TPA: hypothetical protein VK602_09265, partial [Phyllobacterium sp.]|nr:hypothetical protein [Phyllobacterium sp.]
EHTEEYAMYSSGEDMRHFLFEDTGVYKNWKDLSDNGLIQGEGWKYWKNVSTVKASGLIETEESDPGSGPVNRNG